VPNTVLSRWEAPGLIARITPERLHVFRVSHGLLGESSALLFMLKPAWAIDPVKRRPRKLAGGGAG
jgi:hypothetical protein